MIVIGSMVAAACRVAAGQPALNPHFLCSIWELPLDSKVDFLESVQMFCSHYLFNIFEIARVARLIL
jgi:hypothetical protein